MPQPIVVPSTTKRDVIVGIVAGLLVLGFVAYAFLHTSRGVAGKTLTGTITAKHFKPLPETETQITIGKGGVREREVEGEYTFEVRVESENGKLYTVWVDKR